MEREPKNSTESTVGISNEEEIKNLLNAGVPTDYVYYTFNFRNELSTLVDAAKDASLINGSSLADVLMNVAKYLKERDEAASYKVKDITFVKFKPEVVDEQTSFIIERLENSDIGFESIHNKVNFLKLGDKPEEGFKDLGVELVDKYLELGIPAPVLALEIVTELASIYKRSNATK